MFLLNHLLPRVCLLLFSLPGFSATLSAQDYPCRSVEWIVGWGAGGGSDRFARSIAEPVGDNLKVPTKVVNMPGASSIVAMEEVLRRPADGCTIFSITPDQITNEITGLTTLSHRQLTPIMRAHVDIGMMHSKAGGNFRSWQDVVSWAKANPGKLLVGGTGAASFDEIVVNVVMDSAALTYRYIPYEAAKDMYADLLGGRLHVIYDEVSVVSGMIAARQLQPLITLAKKRLDKYPDITTAREEGYKVPPMLWRGIAIKAGTPTGLVAKLEQAFLDAANSEAYQRFEEERLLNLYPGRLGFSGFSALLEEEHSMYKAVIESIQPK